jgi:hypothetical protein
MLLEVFNLTLFGAPTIMQNRKPTETFLQKDLVLIFFRRSCEKAHNQSIGQEFFAPAAHLPLLSLRGFSPHLKNG